MGKLPLETKMLLYSRLLLNVTIEITGLKLFENEPFPLKFGLDYIGGGLFDSLYCVKYAGMIPRPSNYRQLSNFQLFDFIVSVRVRFSWLVSLRFPTNSNM